MEYLPIVLTFLFAAGVAGALLGIPALLAPRRLSPVKLEPFECGKDPIAVSEGRFPIKFSTVAILFILFDIETVFMVPYAVLYKKLGVAGLVEVGIFVAVLIYGLAYLWKRGALEWD